MTNPQLTKNLLEVIRTFRMRIAAGCWSSGEPAVAA